jgi:hypothetical protein
VFDADTPVLRGGRLPIAVSNNASPGDRLQIFAFGHTNVVGNQVLFQNVVIGTFTGGRDSAPLVVDLNLNATTTAVEALVRRIGYRSESTSPVVRRRTIQLDLTDGDGAAAIPRYVKIDVVRN